MDVRSIRMKRSSLLVIIAMSPLVLAVLTGVKSFEVWPQITYLWDMEADPLFELSRIHPHGIRYALMYPILMASEYLGLHHDRLFSLISLINCYFTIRNIGAISSTIVKERRNGDMVLFGCAVALTILFFLMNGRIGFAFLGYSILLLVIVRHHYNRQIGISSLIGMMLGLAFCSVSSGTLISAVLSLVIAVYFEAFRCIRRATLTRSSVLIVLSCIVLGGLLFRHLVASVNKNAAFYGGGSDGILRMLEHGMGRVVYPALDAAGLPLVTLLVVSIMILFSALLLRLNHALLLHILLVAIFCGAFGYSTLSLGAIPLLVLIAVLLTTKLDEDMPDAESGRLADRITPIRSIT